MSNRKRLLAALCTGAAAFLSFAAPAYAGGPCSSHAEILKRACLADRVDDYLVHIADCVYVTDRSGRPGCRGDARDEANEKLEECNDVYAARLEVCDLVGEARFIPEFDPEEFVDPDEIGDTVEPNPYWPLTAGHTHVIVGQVDGDDGEDPVTEVTLVAVTDEVREVGGLPCRVIRDLVFEEGNDDDEDEDGFTSGDDIDYIGLEVTQDWYAQKEDGDVVYCGENTYEVDDDLIDNTDGSFANGKDRALAGYLVRAMPEEGEGDRQEMASDEAEDIVRYESLAGSPDDDSQAYPCAGECLVTFELNPRDPGGAENKYYVAGTGFVLAVKLDEEGVPTGEREAVTCIADSLEDVLDDGMTADGKSCGIKDVAALKEALCVWAPDTPLCEFED